MLLSQFIFVQYDLFLGVKRALFSAVNRVVLPFLSAGVVEVVGLSSRHRGIILLGPGDHLVVESLLQLLGVLHHFLGVVVFGLQVRSDLRRISISQPEVIVHSRVTVQGGRFRNFLRSGGIGHLFSPWLYNVVA